MMPNFSYVRAESVAEAVRRLAGRDVCLHAGGTDLLGCLRDGVFPAETVVSIGGIDELRGIRTTAKGVTIGALTTIAEIGRDDTIGGHFPALAQAARSVASPQLRNQGTLGGNLCQKPRCWYYRGDFRCLKKGGSFCYAAGGENQFHCILGGGPCFIVHPSDTAPALTALDATVMISGPSGQRNVAMADFFVQPSADVTRETVLQPGELVTGVAIPSPAEGLRNSYRKVRARNSWDFAVAGVAVALQLQEGKVKDARIVLSGAAPVPWRCREAEAVLMDRPVDDTTARQAAAEAMRGAQPLGRNGYKVRLFKGLLEEQLLATASS